MSPPADFLQGRATPNICSSKPQSAPGIGDFAYPESAAEFFGERYAHRIRWGHAVNSRRSLKTCLGTSVHMVEADVAAGPLYSESGSPATTKVKTECGQAVIMAHYPTESYSDLSFERFIKDVLDHNAKASRQEEIQASVAAACDTPRPNAGDPDDPRKSLMASSSSGPLERMDASSRSHSSRQEPQADEALEFARELSIELERQERPGLVTSCVGSRRDNRRTPQLTRKGVKLDFKQFECVEPAIRYLRDVDAANKLGGHLWLNADVFEGPGALITPLDANKFVRICAESLPGAVLSLSWGSSMLSTTRVYTDDMVERMIELCMTPSVPHHLPSKRVQDVTLDSTNGADGQADANGDEAATNATNGNRDVDGASEVIIAGAPVKEWYKTPAASCRHITFAVAAAYALASRDGLWRLLSSVPGASLTIFSGTVSLGVTTSTVQELIQEYGRTRLFLDLRVSKPWRTCGTGGCHVQ